MFWMSRVPLVLSGFLVPQTLQVLPGAEGVTGAAAVGCCGCHGYCSYQMPLMQGEAERSRTRGGCWVGVPALISRLCGEGFRVGGFLL